MRLQAARLLAARFGVLEPEKQPETAEIVQAFAAQSDGLSLDWVVRFREEEERRRRVL